MFDGLSFDPFALFDDGFCPTEVGVGGRDVVQALVIALMVVCPNHNRQMHYGKVKIADDTEQAWTLTIDDQHLQVQDLVCARLAHFVAPCT